MINERSNVLGNIYESFEIFDENLVVFKSVIKTFQFSQKTGEQVYPLKLVELINEKHATKKQKKQNFNSSRGNVKFFLKFSLRARQTPTFPYST